MADNVTSFRTDDDDAGGDAETVDKNRLPEADVLKEHLRTMNASKAEMDEIRGDMGAMVKNAENDHNIHRGAFKQAMKLKNMDETKRAEFLAHLDHYREVFDLDAQQDMFRDAS